MLSLGVLTASDYYLNLSRQEGYYQRGQEPPGLWLGKGATHLHLTGEVRPKEFQLLLEGRAPEGANQVQNAGKLNRQKGWDLTFSADKSVSVLWSQADETTRAQIEALHADAVNAALGYLEAEAGWTRRGRGGKEREPVGLVVAAFEHGASRAGDPALHTHALVLNAGVRADGTLGTLVSRELYLHKMTAGALYRAHLASGLGEKLGLKVERQGRFFRVRGVPEPLCREFSKRRVQIEKVMRARGIVSAAGAAAVTLATRKAKAEKSREELLREWKVTGRAFGFSEPQVRALLGQERLSPVDTTPLFEEAVKTLMEGESHFKARQLLRQAAELAPGTGLTGPDLCTKMKTFLETDPELVRVSEDRYTTREMIALETSVLTVAERLHRSKRAGLDPEIVSQASRWAEQNASERQGIAVQLSEEQRAALEHITQTSGSLHLVSGLAGTGKTFFLDAAREAWNRSGYRVLGAALSGKAAQGLQEGSGIESATLARLLMDLDHHWVQTVGHHLWQLTRALQGKKTWGPPERMTLDPKTVLVVDEVSMAGTHLLNTLFTAVEKAGAKLVLVGDAAQLQSIEAGGVFQALQKRLGAAQLTQILRQREEWAREAVGQFARGEARTALQEYVKRGLFTLSTTRMEAALQLINDWSTRGIACPHEGLILTGTRQDRDLLNRMAQERRKKAGVLGFLPFQIAGERFYLGDRVRLTQNSKLYGVRNGMTGTLLSLDPIRNVARIRLEGEAGKRGRVVSLGLNHYKALALGYASTSHGAQGQTVERAFVLADASLQSCELTYVQMSRAKGETCLYADRETAGEAAEALLRGMETSRQKEMALDLPVSEGVIPPGRTETTIPQMLFPTDTGEFPEATTTTHVVSVIPKNAETTVRPTERETLSPPTPVAPRPSQSRAIRPHRPR